MERSFARMESHLINHAHALYYKATNARKLKCSYVRRLCDAACWHVRRVDSARRNVHVHVRLTYTCAHVLFRDTWAQNVCNGIIQDVIIHHVNALNYRREITPPSSVIYQPTGRNALFHLRNPNFRLRPTEVQGAALNAPEEQRLRTKKVYHGSVIPLERNKRDNTNNRVERGLNEHLSLSRQGVAYAQPLPLP